MKRTRREIILVILSVLLSSCAKAESIETTEVSEATQVTEIVSKTEALEQKTAECTEETVMSENQPETDSYEIQVDVSEVNSYFNHVPDTAEFISALQETQDSEYILENSDSVFLTEEEISEFSNEKLRLARNEIFARHGMVFESKILQSFFYTRSWYCGVENCEIKLNKYESYNCDLIQSRENQLEEGKIKTPEQDGWVFLEKQNDKYCYYDMEIDLSQTETDDYSKTKYLVKYAGQEFRLVTFFRVIYKMAARTLDDGKMMILITGEDDTDCIYTKGFELTPNGIEDGPSGAGVPVMCMDNYVCFTNCEYALYGITFVEWYYLGSNEKIIRCMGAYDTGGKAWTVEEPIEATVVNNEGEETKIVLPEGEKFYLLSRLYDQKMWEEEEENACFLRLKIDSTGEIVWFYWRDNFFRSDETPLGARCKPENSNGEGWYRVYRLVL